MFQQKLCDLNLCLKIWGEFGGRNIRAVGTVLVFDELVHMPVKWTQDLLDLGSTFESLLSDYAQKCVCATKVSVFKSCLEQANVGFAVCHRACKRKRSAVDTPGMQGTPSPLADLPPCLDPHIPKKGSKNFAQLPHYRLYWAAKAGCLLCVRRWIEEKKTDPYIASDTHSWTVADWAIYGVGIDRPGAQAVKDYLDSHWPHIPRLP